MSRLVSMFLASTLVATACATGAVAADTIQGWSAEDRQGWYRATQGSRLMPMAWFAALEQAQSDAPFADPAYLASFGFIPDADGTMPVGFAADEQSDRALTFSKLRWTRAQPDDAQWVGLNCAACHTGQVSFNGEAVRIDGGQGLVDFQLFVEAVDEALRATRDDPEKWDRFSAKVLPAERLESDKPMLRAALDRLIAWQEKTDRMNETPVRYGFGRLDAFGHIFNKVLMFADPGNEAGNPSDAPVSYPFVWNIHKQRFVQWNGIAENSRLRLGGAQIEYGALGRNTGEVLGVFGDVKIVPATGLASRLRGYDSSVQARNLDRLERILMRLEPPDWPSVFPPIDTALAAEGEVLFDRKCASCHKDPDVDHGEGGSEVLVRFVDTPAADLTDIWMACNAFTRDGATGTMQGTRDGFLRGTPLEEIASVATMLSAAVKGTLLGAKGDIIREAGLTFIGVERAPVVIDPAMLESMAESGALIDDPERMAREQLCKTTDHRLLAYKARPLDGVWASAPYLHNGSVRTLYDLLLPAERRPKRFWVGSDEFDPVKVGYVSDAEAPRAFELVTVDEAGTHLPANGRQGHEYGAAGFSERERMALVEYMKAL